MNHEGYQEGREDLPPMQSDHERLHACIERERYEASLSPDPVSAAIKIIEGRGRQLEGLRSHLEHEQCAIQTLHVQLKAWEKIGSLYELIRAELVEKEAWELHGGFQAAANGKSIEECRRLASYRLRTECPECGGYGSGIEGEPGAQCQTSCEDCDGTGFIMLPHLAWMENGRVQFRFLPKDHPDYDPTKS